MQPPKLNVSRLDDITVRAEVLNMDGRSAAMFLSKYRNQEVDQIDETAVAINDYAINAEWDACIVARFREVDLALQVVEDHSDEEPSWLLVEAIGGAEFVPGVATFETPWMESDIVDMPVVNIINFPFGPKSKRHYTSAL